MRDAETESPDFRRRDVHRDDRRNDEILLERPVVEDIPCLAFKSDLWRVFDAEASLTMNPQILIVNKADRTFRSPAR